MESVDVSALRRHSRAFRRSAGHIFQKADGSRRPLGIPTFEDKVAQRAIVMGWRLRAGLPSQRVANSIWERGNGFFLPSLMGRGTSA